MNQPQRPRDNKRRRQGGRKPQRQADLWRVPGPLPEVEPVAVPDEVGALLRSLGDPPMNNGAAAAHYFSTVIERAAAVAVALAVSADVLAGPDHD